MRSYRTFSPLPLSPSLQARGGWSGGSFSVALSLGSPPPDVIRHRMSMEPGLSSPASLSARAGAAVQPTDAVRMTAVHRAVKSSRNNSDTCKGTCIALPPLEYCGNVCMGGCNDRFAPLASYPRGVEDMRGIVPEEKNYAIGWTLSAVLTLTVVSVVWTFGF